MLVQQDQIKAIGNALAGYGLTTEVGGGVPSQGRVRDFDEPWRAAAQVVLQAEVGREREAAWEALAGEKGRERLMKLIMAAAPSTRFPSLQEIAPDLPSIEWLWQDTIPLGMITLLGAVPGAGKSFLALDLARRIMDGDTFPDGSPAGLPGARVIYVDAEMIPQLINERADRWGMDKSLLYLMSPPKDKLFIDFSEVEDRVYLIEMAYRLEPALIVIDSLSSINSKGENNVEDVREILGFLNLLAQEVQSGLLLIHHLRKKATQSVFDGMVSIDDFRGSGHIIAMSRSVMGLSMVQTGPELDRNGPRRLEIVKTNLARYPSAIGVEFVPMEPEGISLDYGEAPRQYQEPTKTDAWGEWLGALLEDGEMSPKEVIELGRAEGFSRALIYQVRRELTETITNTEGRKSPSNKWALR